MFNILFGPFRRSFFGTCSVLFHYCHLNLVFVAQHRRQPNRQTHKRIPEELCLALPRASLRSKTNKRWHVIPGVIWINGHIFIYLVFFCLFLGLFWFFFCLACPLMHSIASRTNDGWTLREQRARWIASFKSVVTAIKTDAKPQTIGQPAKQMNIRIHTFLLFSHTQNEYVCVCDFFRHHHLLVTTFCFVNALRCDATDAMGTQQTTLLLI